MSAKFENDPLWSPEDDINAQNQWWVLYQASVNTIWEEDGCKDDEPDMEWEE